MLRRFWKEIQHRSFRKLHYVKLSTQQPDSYDILLSTHDATLCSLNKAFKDVGDSHLLWEIVDFEFLLEFLENAPLFG
jgi:hypothetical protein